MKELWNERYANEDYVYGIEPNSFFAQQITKLPKGNLLLPADGEGRNAVFAAKLGWNVFAFDQSEEGRKKALLLAEKEGVKIDYQVVSIEDYRSDLTFDCIVLTYVHLPIELRRSFHSQIVKMLKPKGYLILEGFEKAQMNRSSGGPKNLSMLFSKEGLKGEFDGLSSVNIEVVTDNLSEGHGHEGMAELIRLVGIK